MTAFADHLTDIADIVRSDVTDAGEVRANIGDSITGTGYGAQTPMWTPDGYIARPNDPDANGAARALYVVDGSAKRIVGVRDSRYASKVGAMEPGDRAIVSDCAARILLKKGNSAITLVSENQQDGDSTMLLDLNGVAGHALIVNGGSYIEIKKDSIVLSAGGSMISVDSTGVAIFGPHTGLNTKSGNLGVINGAAPIAPAASVMVGASGIAAVPAPFWTVSVA